MLNIKITSTKSGRTLETANKDKYDYSDIVEIMYVVREYVTNSLMNTVNNGEPTDFTFTVTKV